MAIIGTAIDSGQNFLQGKLTSTFQQVGSATIGPVMDKAEAVQNAVMSTAEEVKNGAMTTVATLGTAAGSIVGDIYGTGLAALGDLTQCADLAQLVVKDVATYTAQLITDKITGLVGNIPGDVISRMSYWVGNELKTKKEELMEIFTKSGEDRTTSTVEKDQEDKIQKYVGIVTGAVADVQNKVNEFTGGLQEDVAQLTSLMSAGPAFIADKLDTIEQSAEQKIGYFINKQADDLTAKKMDFIDGAAKTIANKMVNKTCDSLKKILQKQVDEVNKQTDKVKQKAKTKIQKAKLALGAALGISVS